MNDDKLVVDFWEKPYKIVRANSGGIRFKIPAFTIRRRGFYRIHLLQKECPHNISYSITLDEYSVLTDAMTGRSCNFTITNLYQDNLIDLFVTWFGRKICIGIFNQRPIVEHPADIDINKDMALIGFVKFETLLKNDWKIEPTSGHTEIIVPKPVSGGELRWVKMKRNDTLPIDALIGGFENEPLYVARALHRGSLCPGKYVKSKNLAYVPWGHLEHAKSEFEVLCGYDALWLKCNSNSIPENAFVAGHSEMHHEPLFIGRAWIHNCLLIGKVHMMYKTCYLPYCEKEFERAEYEILVVGNSVRRGESRSSSCYLNMCMQPCV